MLNHMIAWKGWIFPAKAAQARLAGPTRSEMATFERVVLNGRHSILAPVPKVRKAH